MVCLLVFVSSSFLLFRSPSREQAWLSERHGLPAGNHSFSLGSFTGTPRAVWSLGLLVLFPEEGSIGASPQWPIPHLSGALRQLSSLSSRWKLGALGSESLFPPCNRLFLAPLDSNVSHGAQLIKRIEKVAWVPVASSQ